MARDQGRPQAKHVGSHECVRVEAPGIRFSFPATSRSSMVIACALASGGTLILIGLVVLAALAPAENLSSLGSLLTGKDEAGLRAPERVPVQTDDGIEVIEACPPCPAIDCAMDCPCPACAPPAPPPPAIPSFQTPLPPELKAQ